MEAEENTVKHDIVMNVDSTNITGEWNIKFNGYSASDMFEILNNYSEKDIKQFFDSYFKNKAPMLKIMDYSYDKSMHGILSLHAKFRASSSMVSTDNNLNYVSLKYFPNPIGESTVVNSCSHIVYYTVFNDFDITISLNKQVHVKNVHSEKINEKGMQYDFSIAQQTGKDVSINYSFKSPYLAYDNELNASYEIIRNSILKSFNSLIIYE